VVVGLAAVLAVAALVAPASAGAGPGYRVGTASRSINPNSDGTFGGAPVYLGGYGIGAGGPSVPGHGPLFQGRAASGILGDGIHVRAFVVSDGEDHSFAIADVETQGWFVATRNGPYGLLDMRKEVERRTDGDLPAEDVVVQSDHTHGGPDTIGVWGGVPDSYMNFIKEQAVDAIVDAFQDMRSARLYYGKADGADLLSNQFSYDAAHGNDVLDSDVRVLQARDPASGETFATLLNFSAHPTVLGPSNTKVTGDWPQAANRLLAQRFGGDAVTVVGTLGRTQPADRGCSDPTVTGRDALSLCEINSYAGRVVDRAARAAASAQPVGGDPVVAARSYLIEDPASNGLILGLDYAGGAAGVPINRSLTPPWMSGNVIGTVTASARIGGVLLSSGPGEMYPQIPLKVASLVPAQGYMTAGLANDQLGYLIAPYEAYPEPIRRSFFNQRGDQISLIDNDNYFFNVSHTMGERVACSLLRGAGAVFGRELGYRTSNPRCATFANDLALPHGADTGGQPKLPGVEKPKLPGVK
jgi:hypothetical protein